MANRISAIVLAGGKGTRLGVSKADLVMGQRRGRPVTMLDLVIHSLMLVTDDIVVVGGTQPEMAAVRWTTDRVAGKGPLGGIEAGLSATTRPAALVVGCDMPRLEPAVLRLLARRVLDAPVRPAACVPRTRLGLEPLCAAYTSDCAEVIRDMLRRDDRLRRVSDLLSAVFVDYVEETDLVQFGRPEDLFFNVNTPEDLRVARARWSAATVDNGTCTEADDVV